jgi:hypothetical protein
MKHNQDGAISSLAISLVLVVILLIAAIGFGAWAFSGRQDYKNNADLKIEAAVAAAKTQQGSVDQAQYAEQAKQPLQTYHGPEPYGSLVINFPKTWSAYVDGSGNGSALVDGYFAPGVVPSITDKNSVFALRVQVLSQGYAQTLQNLSSQQQSGKATISAYALPKLPQVVGVKVSGQLAAQGPATTMVVLPLRSQTLEISTQGGSYLNDFNNNILPNFSFSP